MDIKIDTEYIKLYNLYTRNKYIKTGFNYMKELQEKVLDKSEKLVKRINYEMESLSALITMVMIYFIVSYLGGNMNILTIAVIIISTVIYFTLKRLFTIRRNKFAIIELYRQLKDKHPELKIFVPFFSKTHQGFVPRDAGLYVLGDRIYLEAFDFRKRKVEERKSVTIKVGLDFYVTEMIKNEKNKTVKYSGKLMNKDYEFIIPDMPEIIEILDKLLDQKEE